MPSSRSGKVLPIIIIVLLCALVSVFVLTHKSPKTEEVKVVSNPNPVYKVIGQSVQGRKIESYTYSPSVVSTSTPTKKITFVGGVHGGYEWNSVLLAYQFMDYLEANPDTIPSNVIVTVIPSLNPDGVYKVVNKEGRFTKNDVSTSTKILAEGRFNANKVDLNRNFDCKWKPKSTWQSKTVSAGEEAFSEPEALALKNFVDEVKPDAFVFWHSQAGAVYASECKEGVLPETIDIMNAYSKASGYKAVKSFDAYEVTGDSEGWLASIHIPAITIELSTHDSIEWQNNLSGVKALLQYYGLKG